MFSAEQVKNYQHQIMKNIRSHIRINAYVLPFYVKFYSFLENNKFQASKVLQHYNVLCFCVCRGLCVCICACVCA